MVKNRTFKCAVVLLAAIWFLAHREVYINEPEISEAELIFPRKTHDPLYPPFEFEPLYNGSARIDEYKQELFQRLDRIRAFCGQLCENAKNREEWMKHSVKVPGANVRLTLAPDLPRQCSTLIQNVDIDASDTSVPYPPPDELLEFYTMGGEAPVKLAKRYVNVYLGAKASINKWTPEVVEQAIEKATYGVGGVQYLKGKLQELQIGNRKNVLVIGSERPWVEAILLSLGVPRVTTLEYGTIESTHPQITTLTPDQIRQKYATGKMLKFDAIVTHSSVEHSGLGRYGDALNPWGDLLAIARAWCLTTDDAVMYIGVPIGIDQIRFNAHRVYGKMRWSLMATNWEQIDGATHTDGDFIRQSNFFPSGGVGLLFRKVVDFSKYSR
jgi:hypothetical protein